ncbi:MAG: XrtA-associated tyrosine autokinase [Gammaproteobacteria bacterium]|nr:XrtA-associated tyrosine autokinase [Gammaproteobacteria bacterium]
MSLENKHQKPTTIAQLVEMGNNNAVGFEPVKKVKTADAGSETRPEVSPRPAENEEAINVVKVSDRLLAANMLVPGSKLGRDMQDDYRRIKRPLVANAVGRNRSMVDRGNLIFVTSSIPGEGKTYTALNLALSIAQEMDTTVLLIDCDVDKQGASKLLGVEKASGLVDVLESDASSIGDILLQTDIPKLRVVPAGKQHEYVTELLTSHRMTSLINEIASRYTDRIIIFDGPPLLPAPQAQVLAGLVGQVVLVIEAGKTPQSTVEEALALLPDEQSIGLVMNKNEGIAGRSADYHGYYASDDDAQ